MNGLCVSRRGRRLLAPGLLCLGVLCLGALFALPAVARASAVVVGDGVVLSCTRPDASVLRCDYRLTRPGQPLSAVARIGEVPLPAPSFATRTGDPGSIAVLLLIDTSDPGRAAAIRAIQDHVRRIVRTAGPSQRFGLATFDSDLTMRAPIGSSPEALQAALATLQATGRTTELYRNVVEAVRRLATATDEHKVLVVISDGLAEDRAWFHRDAVDAALEHRVTIHAIGYPRSVTLSVGLQSLRRLAEETGGWFVAADTAFALPAGFLDGPIIATPNVGALEVNLASAVAHLGEGSHRVRIGLETGAGMMEAQVPVVLPPRAAAEPVVKVVEIEVPKIVEVEKIVEVAAPPRPPRLAAQPPPAGVPFGYWVVAIGVLALCLLIILMLMQLLRRPAPRPAAAAAVGAPAPAAGLAFLTLDDEPEAPYPIGTPAFRIGRLGDNDLVLRDPSVSRHHAEICRLRDGRFRVLDLDSMNGVLVNSKKVRDGELRHGDVLEVGDVRMSFAVGQLEDFAGEETVMMHTAPPPERMPEAAGGRR